MSKEPAGLVVECLRPCSRLARTATHNPHPLAPRIYPHSSVADQLLVHVYRGERPADTSAFFSDTQLIGYGNASLASLFRPWECPGRGPGEVPSDATATDSAVAVLLAAPRYSVASRLVHLLYTPREELRLHSAAAPARFAVAVHLRRGDKLTEERNAERIQVGEYILHH